MKKALLSLALMLTTIAAMAQEIKSPSEFKNGDIYTFVTSRGWMGASTSSNVISTARTSVQASADNRNFQWAVHQSKNGNFFLYNIGKGMFMGVQSTNNTSIPFASTPAGTKLTFKQSSSTTYPIMFSTDNAGVVNHSKDYGEGLITWTGGWNKLDDEGSNHKVTKVGTLDSQTLATIESLVEAFDKPLSTLYVKAEVSGWSQDNPNTHFGVVRTINGSEEITSNLNIENTTATKEVKYRGTNVTVDFTRDYRGFEFLGYYVGQQDLGKSFTLTQDIINANNTDNPIIAKFKTTKDATLFYDDDPKSYRIPAIGKTSTGRLIAVSDYRHNLDDLGRDNHGTGSHRIDLVIRTSDDNGATWSAKQAIAEGTDIKGSNDCGYGDAAIATIGEKVLIMAAAGDVCFPYGTATAHNRAVRLLSEDNGKTWTKQDISETLFINSDATIPNGYTAFFGSGKLAVDENFNGTGKARIYGGMLVRNANAGNNIYAIYTDDLGLTWHILGKSTNAVMYADEPKVEILPNGQILLSARRVGGRKFNVFTYTDKASGAGNWDTNVDGCNNGGSNQTNGEIYCLDAKRADGTPVKLLLQSQPKGGSGSYDRRDVTIWYKEIDTDATNVTYTASEIAGNWKQGMQVSTQLSSYSAMAIQNDGRIAMFFEEAPCYGDDYTKGYSMVYVPLTIDEITKDNYVANDAVIDPEANTPKTYNIELTDGQGNKYYDTITSTEKLLEKALVEKHPFVTLGDERNIKENEGSYTYSNTIVLPFKVSNADNAYWYNVYFPSNTNDNGYPVYLSSENASDTHVAKVTEATVFGNSQYNTQAYADKISWAIYCVGNSLTFKIKNKLTGKFMKVTGVAGGNEKNVEYAAEGDATSFSFEKHTGSYKGEYAIISSINGQTGYVCSTSVSYGYATNYTGNGHPGAWVKFTEAPDFTGIITEINGILELFGEGEGKYTVAENKEADLELTRTAMADSGNIKYNDLLALKATADTLSEGATLNAPTGIKDISNAIVESTIYDLQGRRVKNISGHGIYIINGQKIAK